MTLDEGFELSKKKQADYGHKNISSCGIYGVIVRMNDKFERLQNLLKTGKLPNNESILDTMRDFQNYGTIGVMILQGVWPGCN